MENINVYMDFGKHTKIHILKNGLFEAVRIIAGRKDVAVGNSPASALCALPEILLD